MKTYTLITVSDCCDSDGTTVCYGTDLEATIKSYLEESCCKKVKIVAAFEGTPIDLMTETIKKDPESDYDYDDYGGGAL